MKKIGRKTVNYSCINSFYNFLLPNPKKTGRILDSFALKGISGRCVRNTIVEATAGGFGWRVL